ncbi:hypothetical protein C8E95_0436 [Pseudonocardia autotrophica]|uniref:Uncharacterized protein n=1 Tax=Pseudonocardia autotrophica TaxID=2074 RepID=A0A1Y2N2Q4_PSEAH|nr:hypothetical protein BG845_01940 [Pseudonocardia autotrophica]TDN71406.1 hypothetical protein C8E95_0436 [Pseudonocardia autotrophica]
MSVTAVSGCLSALTGRRWRARGRVFAAMDGGGPAA